MNVIEGFTHVIFLEPLNFRAIMSNFTIERDKKRSTRERFLRGFQYILKYMQISCGSRRLHHAFQISASFREHEAFPTAGSGVRGAEAPAGCAAQRWLAEATSRRRSARLSRVRRWSL